MRWTFKEPARARSRLYGMGGTWFCIDCGARVRPQRRRCDLCRKPSAQQLAAKNATTPTREYRYLLSLETRTSLEEWERMERARRMIDGG